MGVRQDGILQLQRYALQPASGSAVGLATVWPGEYESVILAPVSPLRRLRLFYLSYNPSVACEVMGFQFGPTPETFILEDEQIDWFRNNRFLRNLIVVGGTVIAKEFGDNKYWQGGIGEKLYLVVKSAAPVVWNVMFVEI